MPASDNTMSKLAVCVPDCTPLPEDVVFMPDYSPDTMDAEIPTTSDDQCIYELRTCSLDSGVAGCYRLPRARSTNSTLSRLVLRPLAFYTVRILLADFLHESFIRSISPK